MKPEIFTRTFSSTFASISYQALCTNNEIFSCFAGTHPARPCVKKEKWFWMMLILVMDGILMIDCVFSGHDYNTNKDTLVKYTYSFKYPTLKLTLENETAVAVTGTASEHAKYRLTFVDAKGSSVWIPVETSKAM